MSHPRSQCVVPTHSSFLGSRDTDYTTAHSTPSSYPLTSWHSLRSEFQCLWRGREGRGGKGKGKEEPTTQVGWHSTSWYFFFKVPRHCWNQRWVIWKKTRPGLKPRCSLKLKFFPFMGYLQYYFYCLYLKVYNTFDRHRHIERIIITSKLVYLSAHNVGACQGWSS